MKHEISEREWDKIMRLYIEQKKEPDQDEPLREEQMPKWEDMEAL